MKRREAVAPVVEAVRRAGATERVLVAAFAGRRTARHGPLWDPRLATGAGHTAIARLLATRTFPWLPVEQKLPPPPRCPYSIAACSSWTPAS